MRLRWETFEIHAVVLVLFAVVIGFLLYGGNTIGFTDADTRTLISLMPGVVCLFIAFYVASQTKGFLVAGAVAGIGLSLSFLIYLMNSADVLIPDVGIGAPVIETVIIVVFMILAVALAVTRRT